MAPRSRSRALVSRICPRPASKLLKPELGYTLLSASPFLGLAWVTVTCQSREGCGRVIAPPPFLAWCCSSGQGGGGQHLGIEKREKTHTHLGLDSLVDPAPSVSAHRQNRDRPGLGGGESPARVLVAVGRTRAVKANTTYTLTAGLHLSCFPSQAWYGTVLCTRLPVSI
jgi:hypothetical protein